MTYCMLSSKSRKVLPEPFGSIAQRWRSPILWPSARHQPKLQFHGHGAVCHTVCLFTSQTALVQQYTASRQRQMCVHNLPTVALDSTVASIEPTISDRKSKPNHYATKPDVLLSVALKWHQYEMMTDWPWHRRPWLIIPYNIDPQWSQNVNRL